MSFYFDDFFQSVLLHDPKFKQGGPWTEDEKEQMKSSYVNDLPKINPQVTTAELTKIIQNVVPEYYFYEGDTAAQTARKERSDKLRSALLDYSMDKYTGLNKKMYDLYHTNASRDYGAALSIYVQKYMPTRKADLEKLAQMPAGPEKANLTSALKLDVIKHIADHAEEYTQKLRSINDDQLIENLSLFEPLSKLTDTAQVIFQDLFKGNDKQREEIKSKLDPLFSVASMLEMKTSALMSPMSQMVDFDQLSNISSDQCESLKQATQKIYYEMASDDFDPISKRHMVNQDGWFDRNNIFSYHGLQLMIGTQPQIFEDSAKKALGLKSKDKLSVIDMSGKEFKGGDARDICLKEGTPVYFRPKNEPDREPVIGFIRNGKTYIGQEAVDAYVNMPIKQKPLPPEPNPERDGPKGFWQSWDNFCKKIGWESARPSSAKALKRATEEYNAAVQENERIKLQEEPKKKEVIRKLKEAGYTINEQKVEKEKTEVQNNQPEIEKTSELLQEGMTEVNTSELLQEKPKKEENAPQKEADFSDKQEELDNLKRTTVFSSDANSKEMLAVKESLQQVLDDRENAPKDNTKLIQDLFTLKHNANKYIRSHSTKNERYNKVVEIGKLAQKQLEKQDPLEVIEVLAYKLGDKANSDTMEQFQDALEKFKEAKESNDKDSIHDTLAFLDHDAEIYKDFHSNHNERYDIVQTIGKIAGKKYRDDEKTAAAGKEKNVTVKKGSLIGPG